MTVMKTALGVIALALVIGCEASSNHNKESKMFRADSKPYVIFSPMEGQLLKDGAPMENARIIRKLRWNGNEEGEITEFRSGKDGWFSIPSYEKELRIGMLDQFVAKAEISVEAAGEVYEIWFSSKLRPEIYDETDGKLEGLVCDVSSEELVVPKSPTAILTRCTWKNMPE